MALSTDDQIVDAGTSPAAAGDIERRSLTSTLLLAACTLCNGCPTCPQNKNGPHRCGPLQSGSSKV